MRSSVQVVDLRKCGVLSSMKRWAWENMNVWTMGEATLAVPSCPSSSSFALLDVLPRARLQQEWCEVVCPSCRLEEVRDTFQHEEVGLGEDEGVNNGGS